MAAVSGTEFGITAWYELRNNAALSGAVSMPLKNVPVEASVGRVGEAQPAKTKLRYPWHEFFKRFDVLLTPVAATAAFPHNRNPNREERTVSVNGKSVLYAEQLFFAGLASLMWWCWRCRAAACPSPMKSPAR